jgi:hypothetical protein
LKTERETEFVFAGKKEWKREENSCGQSARTFKKI